MFPTFGPVRQPRAGKDVRESGPMHSTSTPNLHPMRQTAARGLHGRKDEVAGKEFRRRMVGASPAWAFSRHGRN